MRRAAFLATVQDGCGPRQVEGVATALQYDMGLGSAYIVSIYEKADCKCSCRTTSTEAR